MASIDQMLAEYAADHRHPANQQLHTVCVPVIFISLVGLLTALPVPAGFGDLPPFVNWASLALAAAVAWYMVKSLRFGMAMLVVSAVSLMLVACLASLPWPLWASSTALFVVAWIGQFVGHHIEGKRPSFFRDLQFLLVGPLWVIVKLVPRLNARD